MTKYRVFFLFPSCEMKRLGRSRRTDGGASTPRCLSGLVAAEPGRVNGYRDDLPRYAMSSYLVLEPEGRHAARGKLPAYLGDRAAHRVDRPLAEDVVTEKLVRLRAAGRCSDGRAILVRRLVAPSA
jgi:hypothetical protein